MLSTATSVKLVCYHCGDDCKDIAIRKSEKVFCCDGCKLVYELLSENNLCTYYQLDQHPGSKPEYGHGKRFAWLDDETTIAQLLTFAEKEIATVKFSIPGIHCVSCIWLLENLNSIEKGVIHVNTDFLKKEVTITFNRNTTSLRKVVEKLAAIGYEPYLRLNDLQQKKATDINRALFYKIGVAGFCFGNIMMLSFPEYLTGVSFIEPQLKQFFSYLNLILALPVFFYSAGDYFIGSFKAARQKYFSIDLPIALGLLAMLLRSTYEIISGTGAGYFDSMTGLVFFLLIGKYFQSLTFRNLSFERDYKSYFPIATTVIKDEQEVSTPISNLKVGDKILLHSEELIPADAFLMNGTASIDYSFVTGESIPVSRVPGELIFAGGKQKGPAIELLVHKTVEQSYLTQLWNHESFQKNKHASLSLLADTISKYFTIAILLIALATAVYWIPKDVHRGILACTAILIVACPCALAITVPFTFGNIIRILGRNNFYLKNASVVAAIAKTDAIVFDKTGTVTVQTTDNIRFVGRELTPHEWNLVKTLSVQSIHPLSKKIAAQIDTGLLLKIDSFREITGAGIAGEINGDFIRMGSADFISNFTNGMDIASSTDTRVYISINSRFAGYFFFASNLREGFGEQILALQKDFQLFLLSGDQEGDRELMQVVFPQPENLFFQQSPTDKLNFIKDLQLHGKKVLMIGDGLNDAGALQQSNVGIAVCEELAQFSPASDAIMKGSEFKMLHQHIQFCKAGIHIIWFTFSISLLYNLVGVTFAVRGDLSPMIAAILMPLSSISVIIITTLAVRWRAKKLGL